MEFIYDIVLNFQDEYCEFFEWQLNDKILNVKKIPLYKISSKDYLILKYNDVVIQESVFHKKYRMILVTNGIEVMGLLLNSNNKVIKRSSLIIEEADDVLEYLSQSKITDIKYLENKKRVVSYDGRIMKEKLGYVSRFLKDINLERDEYLLKYLYYDLYNQEEVDVNKIYNILCKKKREDVNKIYKSIQAIKNI